MSGFDDYESEEVKQFQESLAKLKAKRSNKELRLGKALQEVQDELSRATTKFPPFHGYHEGYAVILEELDELWDEVKKKSDKRDKEVIALMRAEAIQIAAMALRFVVDLT
jgi:hypothetical protein